MVPVKCHRSGRNPLGRVRKWLSERHTLPVEVLVMVAVYLAYDSARGLAGGGRRVAVAHAQRVADLERRLHLDPEREIQRVASHVPAADAIFGFGYATFHLGVTALVLLWLFRRHQDSYAVARTAIVLATALALIGFVVFPTAPPRAAGIGISDTLDLGRETARSGLLRLLYNPYAAMPSVHIAFAVIAGGSIAMLAGHRWARATGVLYPAYVAIEVMATGNHFLADIAAGAVTGLLGVGFALVIVFPRRPLIGQEKRAGGQESLEGGRVEVGAAGQVERGVRWSGAASRPEPPSHLGQLRDPIRTPTAPAADSL